MMSDQMDRSVLTALEQLHTERARIEGAIAKLEHFVSNLMDSASHSPRRRDYFVTQKNALPYQRSRAGWTTEAREAASNRMKNYWSQRRQEAESKGETPKNPRKRIKSIGSPNPHSRSKEGWTSEAREAASNRMKNYWSERKNNTENTTPSPHTP